MNKNSIKSLYYITHINNLPSILERGILSHKKVEELQVTYQPIYDSGIVSKRKDKRTPERDSLWEYANLYFQARNPMMYRVVHEKEKRDIAIVGVKSEVLQINGGFVTDGNAANDPTQFFPAKEGLKIVENQWKIIQSDWWNDQDGSKRKIMSECLIPNQISPEFIHSIFVVDHVAKQKVESIIGSTQIHIVPEPHMFFQPKSAVRIGKNISVIDGDMFFSNMQTLTISVNLQGVMGKGLASRAKYQFPDVYVVYQDACRKKQLTATIPYLYKREASLDQELADLSVPLSTPNAVKWFLFFTTKKHWKQNSNIEDIEGGLDWVRKNYHSVGIKSLAMPALGCGLGNLTWNEVGPLMCSYLHDIDIQVAIYLPREHPIQNEYLTDNFLLKKNV
ncbi:MAG: DarT ssDNA thymidine ADP-ribosyltransferase family protein [Stanieria sp.]